MRVFPVLLWLTVVVSVGVAGEVSPEGMLPGHHLARGCGDQLAQRLVLCVGGQGCSGECVVATHRSVYVSTIDGALTALDEQGHTLWTYRSSTPLFHSSLNPLEVCGGVPQRYKEGRVVVVLGLVLGGCVPRHRVTMYLRESSPAWTADCTIGTAANSHNFPSLRTISLTTLIS